jgi:hypothetical protein
MYELGNRSEINLDAVKHCIASGDSLIIDFGGLAKKYQCSSDAQARLHKTIIDRRVIEAQITKKHNMREAVLKCIEICEETRDKLEQGIRPGAHHGATCCVLKLDQYLQKIVRV